MEKDNLSHLRTLKDRMVRLLAEPGASRVFTPAQLLNWLKGQGLEVRIATTLVHLKTFEETGLVEKVRRGIYINRRAQPHPTLDEVAPFLRPGAVVSLQRVLGRAGVLNNPTEWITCVMPLERSRTVGEVKAAGTTFTFSALSEKLLPKPTADWAEDAYDPYAAVPTATPEKALADWLYLARKSPVWRAPPAHDLDLEELDLERMDRLATRMGIKQDWHRLKVSAGLAEEAREKAVHRARKLS